MSDASFVIGFDGKAGTLGQFLSALKSQIRSDVSDMQAAADKLELFGNVQAQGKEAEAAFASTKAAVQALRVQLIDLESSGGTATNALTKGLKDAQREAAAAEKALSSNQATLTKLDAQLKLAGVDTSKLATEQLRLADAVKVATVAATQQQAKDLLGVKTLRDIAPEIAKLEAAYATLNESGTLTYHELLVAQKQLATQTAELRAQVAGVGDSLKSHASDITSAFTAAATKIFIVVESVKEVAHALAEVTDKAREYQTGLAEIGAVTSLTETDLNALGEAARGVARNIGVDVVDALKDLREIMRSTQLGPDDAIRVLEVSSQAAKASVSDLGDVIKVGDDLIKGYGVTVGGLEHAYDVLFASMKSGGPTFHDFAAGMGDLLPVAKAAHVGLDDLTAILSVMVKGGEDAGSAMGDLQKIILKLDTSQGKKALHDLGIEGGSLVDTFKQLADKNLGLDQILELGISSKKSATGIAALTESADKLTTALRTSADAAGSTAAAMERMENTPKERLERFTAAVNDLKITVGETLGASSKFAAVLTVVLNAFNSLSPAVKEAHLQGALLSAAFSALGPAGQVLGNGFNLINNLLGITASRASETAASLAKLNTEASAAAASVSTSLAGLLSGVNERIGGVDKAIKDLRDSLGAMSTELAQLTAATQQAGAASLASLKTLTDERIAALDRGNAAETKTAQATIDIQTQAAKERLAIIVNNAAEVSDAFEKEAAARLAIAKRAQIDVTKVELDINIARRAALAPTLAAYQAHYNDLISLAQAAALRVQAIDKQAADFNLSLEGQIAAVRRQGLDAYSAYQSKVREIDEITYKARLALQQGDLTTAEELAKRAQGLIGGISNEVKEGNRVEVEGYEAQRNAVSKLEEVGRIVNAVLKERKESAVEAATAEKSAADLALLTLTEFRDAYNETSAEIKKGIDLRINKDTKQVDDTLAALDVQLKEREHLVDVRVDVESAIADIEKIRAELKKPGTTLNIDANVDLVKFKLEEVAKDAPELNVQINQALGEVQKLDAAVTKIGTIEPNVNIKSNAAAVQAEVDKLATPRETTLKIKLEYESGDGTPAPAPPPGLNLGGLVQRVQQFARGGSVFSRPSWSKVPGSGNTDTVPALLNAGSFVVRKAASAYYGDGIMGRLASGVAAVRRFARGGVVKDLGNGIFAEQNGPKPDPTSSTGYESDYFGDIKAGTTAAQRTAGEIAAPTLPSDPKELAALVLRYAADVAHAAYADDYFYWKPNLDAQARYGKAYDSRPSDANLQSLLNISRAIGLNLGITHSRHTGFDVDGRSWHQVGRISAPAGLGGADSFEYDFYNSGGGVSDTVPAMLTPGEFVVQKSAVSRYGSGLLHAINSMAVPRSLLQNMIAPPVPHFATGGPVGLVDSPGGSGGIGGTSGGEWHIHLNVPLTDVLNEAAVRRILIPAINDIARRGR